MSVPIMVGKKVEDFKLHDHNEKEVVLSSLAGRKVLLSFHPLAWTGICTQQMQDLDQAYSAFTDLNTVPLGVSVDTVPSKKAWAESMGLKSLQLVADFWPHGDLAKKLGIFREANGFSERANVLLDEQGNVEWIKVYEIKALPNLDEVFAQLKK